MKNCKDCRHFEAHKRGNLCWSDFDRCAVVNQLDDDILEGEKCVDFAPKSYQIGDVFEARITIVRKHMQTGYYIITFNGFSWHTVNEEALDKLKLVEREKLTPAGEEAREMSS